MIGADGSRSRVRALLTPLTSLNQSLPVRLLGVSVVYPSSIAFTMRELDPFVLMGGDPQSDVFFLFSFLDTPINNAREDNPDSYECQIVVSWPYRSGFQGREAPLEVPLSNEGRIDLMKSFAQEWAEPFKEIVNSIPPGTEAKNVSVEDWAPKRGMWDNRGGKVTMIGDAAHTMTMCTLKYFQLIPITLARY